MHGFRLGKTNRLAGQALDSCSEQQVLVLDLLGVPFADRVFVGRDQLGIAAPVVGEKAGDVERGQPVQQRLAHRVGAPAEHERQHPPGRRVDGVPKPPLVALVADEAPLLVGLGLRAG